jgi:putative FmdB family regulatory protein
MPLYSYKCNNCGYEETSIEKVENRDNHKCPKCGNIMERTFILTIPAIRYLAPGFYSTRDWDLMFTPEPKVQNSIAKEAEVPEEDEV